MWKNISVWLALISVTAIAAVFLFSLGGGSSAAKDLLYTDLTSFKAFVKNGYEPAYASLDPELTEWDLELPAKHNTAILMKSVPLSDYSNGKSEFLWPGEHHIEDFTILIPFELSSQKISALYGDNPIAPGMYLAGIGENWEIYLNGDLISKQIYLNPQNKITSFRSQRSVSIPFDKKFLNEGTNRLVIHIIGSRGSATTGMFYTGPYYIGNYTRISGAGTTFLTVALCTFFIFLGLYHILLFLMRKTDMYNLLFGIFSGLLAVYYVARSPVIYHIFADTAITQRVEYGALYLLLFAFAVFLENLNFGKVKITTIIYGISCAALIVMQCFFTIWFADDLVIIWQIYGGAYMLYIVGYDLMYPFVKNVIIRYKTCDLKSHTHTGLWKSITTCLKQTEQGNILIPVIIVFCAAVFDMLDLAFIHTGALLTRYGFSLLMLCMAFLLARKYTNRFEAASQMNEMLEATVKQRTVQLEEQVQVAKAASKAKSEFLSNVSHEIRTPMNAIIGISQIQLQKESIPHEFEEAFEKIYGSGNGLLGIINDILDMLKIESGKLELTPTEYDLPSLINDEVQINIVRIGSKPIEFSLDLDENLPLRMFGDELRIKQILNNLISNAIKYTKQGFVKLSVNHSVNESEILLRLSVSDSGQGLKPEDCEKLFSEYQRFNAEANRTTEGTGLGLNITRNLAAMMGGQIDVQSEYGKGSTFTATVKQKAVECGVIGKKIAENLRNFNYVGEKHLENLQLTYEPMPYGKVLIVDDVETNLYVAEGLLSPYKLEMETAMSGFAALDKVQEGKIYDVIFMDHMMPKMDGIETTKKIRELGYEGVIVALTANALAGNEEMFKQHGFDGFISKPIDIKNLNTALNKFVRDRHPDEAAKYEAEAIEHVKHAVSPKLLEVFSRDAQKAVVTLRETVKNGDIKLFTTTAHAMKSALANVGEDEKSAFALELEKAGKNNDIKYINANTERFIAALENLVKSFAPKEDVTNSQAEDIQEDSAYLTQEMLLIKEACENYDDTAAYAAFDRIKEKQWKAQTASMIEEIRDLLFLHSDFDEAAAKASKMLDVNQEKVC